MFSFPDSPETLLQSLVAIPSVNPDSAKNQGATGEFQCAEWVGEFLARCGADVTFEEVLPGRPNVLGRFSSQTGDTRPGLLLAPHLDTVSVAGMTVPPFGGEIRDGRLYGRGASDTKGTMAAMLWALHTLRDQLDRMSCAVSFVGLMGEEAGQPGSKHFAAHHGQEYSFALVGEPTNLKTVYAHKGCVWLKLTVRGKACHGSTPENGINAIRPMLRLVPGLLEHLERKLPDYTDAVLGCPTVSLGMIQGGSSPNIVPDECSVVLDCRETPALHQAGGALALVREYLAHSPETAGVEISVLGDSVPLHTPPEHDDIARLLSIGSELTTAPWFCDAGRLAEGGIPSVACGPGSIEQAHTKDEFLRLSDLHAGVEFYREFLRTYL